MRRLPLKLLLGAVVAVSACRGGGYSSYSVGASVSTPDMAYVSPGVYALTDWNEPVFYSDNFYWRHADDGRWLRSRYHGSGWHYASPPRVILSIRQPSAYVRYRPSYRADAQYQRPIYRDHRQYQRPIYYRDGRRYRY